MPTQLGKKIRQLRKEKGWTLGKLAELADSSKSYVWELENKDPPRPSGEKVIKIATALGVTADYLLDHSKKTPNKDVIETVFFRDYQELDESDKKKIRDMVKAWGNKK